MSRKVISTSILTFITLLLAPLAQAHTGMHTTAGLVDGLPVGLQLIGNYFEEGRLLAAAHRYQQVTDWHTRVPPGFE